MANNAKKQEKNFLDFIPVINDKFRYEIVDQKVTIFQENKGVFNRIFQVLLKKPKVTQIHLDEMGSFIWPLMDGEKTVFDISGEVKEYFGEKAEPLIPRLVQYFKMLKNYDFIKLLEK